MRILAVLIVYIIIGLYEITPLVREKKTRELWVYAILFSAAFIISILFAAEISIPSPAAGIRKVVSMVMGG